MNFRMSVKKVVVKICYLRFWIIFCCGQQLPTIAKFGQQDQKLFHNGGRYHIETSPLICFANQWAGFYTIGTSVMKELRDAN